METTVTLTEEYWASLGESQDDYRDQSLCLAGCSHGGVCTQPAGHDGVHDASGYCQWSDEDGKD